MVQKMNFNFIFTNKINIKKIEKVKLLKGLSIIIIHLAFFPGRALLFFLTKKRNMSFRKLCESCVESQQIVGSYYRFILFDIVKKLPPLIKQSLSQKPADLNIICKPIEIEIFKISTENQYELSIYSGFNLLYQKTSDKPFLIFEDVYDIDKMVRKENVFHFANGDEIWEINLENINGAKKRFQSQNFISEIKLVRYTSNSFIVAAIECLENPNSSTYLLNFKEMSVKKIPNPKPERVVEAEIETEIASVIEPILVSFSEQIRFDMDLINLLFSKILWMIIIFLTFFFRCINSLR